MVPIKWQIEIYRLQEEEEEKFNDLKSTVKQMRKS